MIRYMYDYVLNHFEIQKLYKKWRQYLKSEFHHKAFQIH